MTRKLMTMLAAAAVLVAAGSAYGAIPRTINFQGRLADASGTPKTGSYAMTFSIWSAATGGTACFTETQTVAANSGLFNANIGGATSGGIATACNFSVPYWLQLQVGSDSAMTPRIALTSAAYAFRAAYADDSALLGGYALGTASGNIPRNSGTLMTDLNADLLDGIHASTIQANALAGVSKALYTSHSLCGTFVSASSTCTGYTYYASCIAYCSTSFSAPACPSGCTDGGQTCLADCTYWDGEYNQSGKRYRRTCTCNNTLFGYVKP